VISCENGSVKAYTQRGLYTWRQEIRPLVFGRGEDEKMHIRVQVFRLSHEIAEPWPDQIIPQNVYQKFLKMPHTSLIVLCNELPFYYLGDNVAYDGPIYIDDHG
jgi:hypothetical protein